MNVTVHFPEELAARLNAEPGLDRRVLELLALEEFRADRLTEPELQKLLGFDTRYELDGFLKQRGFLYDYTITDLEEERRILDRFGA